MSSITPFDFNGKEVRAIEGQDGSAWFVAKDVCEILGHSNPSEALKALDTDEKGDVSIPYASNDSNDLRNSVKVRIVSEAGLYQLIFVSRLPAAVSFRKWVTSEVLPAIRKHGAYMTPEAIEKTLTDPDFIIGIATALKNEQAKSAKLTAINAKLEPKAAVHDALMLSDTALPIGSIAKVLCKDFNIGRNRLFKFLRDRGVLLANNEPKQPYIERGYFRVVERRFEVNGEMKVGTQTLVYQKGVSFIHRLLTEEAKRKAA
jgi:anti-repressor protein